MFCPPWLSLIVLRSRVDQALTTLHAHFLKSVSLEIGQVASSVSLLTRRCSSKNGMNTRPAGNLVRLVERGACIRRQKP